MRLVVFIRTAWTYLLLLFSSDIDLLPEVRRAFLNKIFDRELEGALENDLAGEKLNQVDKQYLRESASRARTQLLEPIKDESEQYISYRAKLVAHKLDRDLPASRVEPRLTLYRCTTIVGLALLITSAFFAQRGVRNAETNWQLLVTSAPLIITAILCEFVNARGAMRVQLLPILESGCVALSSTILLASIATPVQTTAGSPNSSNAGTALLSLALVAVILAAPFTRWQQRFHSFTRSGTASHSARASRLRPKGLQRLRFEIGPPFIILTTLSVAILVALLVQGSNNREVYFAAVQRDLAGTGLALCIIAAILTAWTSGSQPRSVRLNDLTVLDANFRSMLRSRVLLPFLRKTADEQVDSYDTVLRVGETPGLSQTLDPMLQVATDPVTRLQALLSTMPGGSIGIAGPRGAGKSTLIDQFCGTGDDESLATTVSAPVDYLPRDFLLHLYASLCQRAIGPERSVSTILDPGAPLATRRQSLTVSIYGILLTTLGVVLVAIPTSGIQLASEQLTGSIIIVVGLSFLAYALMRYRALKPPDREYRPQDISEIAVERFKEIRYQQTISSTSTGAAKLPVGIEATFASARSFAKQQMTLPEIVASMRDFLESAAKQQKTVLIGIDELDKIGSGDRAIHFLNEIKGIFGVRGCFFLVSVSEEAMAGFERRGLPFRDAFDSSFDEIVRVSPLALVEASALLRRRLFGMPAPFKQLCYCQSGGLPRDLIRSARSVVSVAEGLTTADLSSVTSKVVADDLQGKISAALIVGRQPLCEPLTSSMLKWCIELPGRSYKSKLLLDHISALHSRNYIQMASTVRELDGYDTLQTVILELACYSYYSATIIDFFDTSADHSRWRANESEVSAPRLAKIRTKFASSHLLAWQEVSSFRSDMGLATVPEPAWLAHKFANPPLKQQTRLNGRDPKRTARKPS